MKQSAPGLAREVFNAARKGVTGEKAQVRDDLEDKILVIADAIAAFATKSGDRALAGAWHKRLYIQRCFLCLLL